MSSALTCSLPPWLALVQVVLFCRLVGPTSLRPGATELRLALEASGRMGTGGGRDCCEESDSEGSAATPNSSHFHLEVLRSVSHSLGAWDPTTEVRQARSNDNTGEVYLVLTGALDAVVVPGR